MPNKGTVIEVYRNRAVIMSERCEFVKIKTTGVLSPGDEVKYSADDIIAERRYSLRILSVAASFIICCFAAFYAFQYMFVYRTYAYIGLEINPSLEIAVNSKNMVVNATGFNDEGLKLIQESHLLKAGLDIALKTILRQSVDNEYLQKNYPNNIGVSLYIPGKNNSQEHITKIEEILKEVLAENRIEATVFIFNIDKHTREEALKLNVSSIRYLLWSEAKKQGISMALEAVSFKNPEITNIAFLLADRLSCQNEESGPAPLQGGPGEIKPAEPERQPGSYKSGEISSLNQGPSPADQIRQSSGEPQDIITGNGANTSSPVQAGPGNAQINQSAPGNKAPEIQLKQGTTGATSPGAGKDAEKTGGAGGSTGGNNSTGKSGSGRR